MRTLASIFFALSILSTTQCARPKETAKFALLSGRTVGLRRIFETRLGNLKVENGENGAKVLVFEYETLSNIHDLERILPEMNDVWASFRPMVEKQHISYAIVCAIQRASSKDMPDEGFSEYFMRGADGLWTPGSEELRYCTRY